LAASALKLAPKSEAVELETALAFALAGDSDRAELLGRDVGARYKLDTQTQALWLPTIQAQSELNHKEPAADLKTLQSAVVCSYAPFSLTSQMQSNPSLRL